MLWTEARIELATSLWAKGYSATEIGAELHISRNAVLGKLHRLKAPHPEGKKVRQRQSYPEHQTPKPRPGRTHPIRINALVPIKPRKETFKAPLPRMVEPPPETAIAPMDLTDAVCQWPIGEPGHPEFKYCGGNPLRGRPYCGHHARVSYQSPPKRQPPTTPSYKGKTSWR